MGTLQTYLETEEITKIRAIRVPNKINNEIQAFQDLLVYALKGISQYAFKCRQRSIMDSVVDIFTEKTLRQTYLVNTTDPNEIAPILHEAVAIRERAKTLHEWAGTPYSIGPSLPTGPAAFEFATDPYNISVQAQIISFERTLVAGSTTHIFLEDICLLELVDLIERANVPKINEDSDGTVHTLVHQVLDILAGNPDTAKLTWLADQLSECKTPAPNDGPGEKKIVDTAQNVNSIMAQNVPAPRPTVPDFVEANGAASGEKKPTRPPLRNTVPASPRKRVLPQRPTVQPKPRLNRSAVGHKGG